MQRCAQRTAKRLANHTPPAQPGGQPTHIVGHFDEVPRSLIHLPNHKGFVEVTCKEKCQYRINLLQAGRKLLT